MASWFHSIGPGLLARYRCSQCARSSRSSSRSSSADKLDGSPVGDGKGSADLVGPLGELVGGAPPLLDEPLERCEPIMKPRL